MIAHQNNASSSQESSGPFSRATVIAIIFIGIFTLSSFIVLSAYAPILREKNDGAGHALSKSAIGYAFLAALLEKSGIAVLTPRGAIPEPSDGVLIFTPPEIDSMEGMDPLNEYQVTVVILPKWHVSPDPKRPNWVRQAGLKASSPLKLTMGDAAVSIETNRREGDQQTLIEGADATGGLITHMMPTRNIGAIQNLQYLLPDENLEPILTAENGDILLAKVKNLSLFIISDEDLANTQGLNNVDRAKLTTIFIDHVRFGGPVIFDMSLHGVDRTRNIVRLALEPPFLAATLCTLFAALLLALKSAIRFGPTQAITAPFENGKAALADNSAALIRMAKREEAFGQRYAEMIRRQIGKLIGAPRNLDAQALDTLIDKIAVDKGKTKFSSLISQAQNTEDIGSFIQAANKLFQFKKEITRDNR